MNTAPTYLKHHFLIAMPAMEDPRFAQTVVYLCAHSAEGAMGLVLNRPLARPSFSELLEQLELKPVPPASAITLAASSGETCVISVTDTGVGIEPTDLPKLFKPFHTTKPDGNGLGLATTRKIVLAHGGTIAVQSEPGRGTQFTINLPAAPPGLTS